MTLQCQRPATGPGTVLFALLKAGSAAPVQVRAPAGRETDFSLRNVSASDNGNYSCVYFQARAPFLTSEASPHLELWVAGKLWVPRDLGVFPSKSGLTSLGSPFYTSCACFLGVDSLTSFWPHWVSAAAPGHTRGARRGSAGVCGLLSAPTPGSPGSSSVTAAPGLSGSTEGGILPGRGSHLRPLHRRPDSEPLGHQGGPRCLLFNVLSFLLSTPFSLLYILGQFLLLFSKAVITHHPQKSFYHSCIS